MLKTIKIVLLARLALWGNGRRLKSPGFSLILTLLIGVSTLTPVLAAQAEHPLLSRFPDSTLNKTSERHFNRYQLIVARDGEQGFKTQTVSGSVYRANYAIDKKYSEETILENYLQALNQKGAEILFVCRGVKICGASKPIKQIVWPLNDIGDSHPHLLTARLSSQGVSYYVSVFIFSWEKENKLQLDIIEEKAMPMDLVSVDINAAVNAGPMAVDAIEGKDADGARDHPLLSRIAGSRIRTYREANFDKTHLVVGIDKANYDTRPVQGKLTRIHYQVPRNRSELEIIENYRYALKEAGFSELFSCEGLSCGKKNAMAQAVMALDSIGFDQNQRYLAAELKRPDGNVYVAIYLIGHGSGLNLNISVIEEKALALGEVAVDADAITQAIDSQGHVALMGLHFEHNSAELTAASDAVLKEIAKYIQANHSKRFYVVGHTDDSGSIEYNKTLSERRAHSVVKALVEKYKINPSTLKAFGVGEVAPVASNSYDQGKQENRRVELVLRSDDS